MARSADDSVPLPPPGTNENITAAPPEPDQEFPGLLANLACAGMCPEGAYSQIYDHLGSTLSMLEQRAFELKQANFVSEMAGLAGPLIARSLLELTCTALLGRFDPFRVLIVRETQMQEDYVFTERNPIALNWQADFHPDSTKGVGTVDLKTKVDNMPRALLGKYIERVLWREAVERFVDHTVGAPEVGWLSELKRTEPVAFIPKMRTQIQELYSSCSKGIHQEFVINTSSYAEALNVRTQIGTAIELMAKLALIFDFSPHVLRRPVQAKALEQFKQLSERWLA